MQVDKDGKGGKRRHTTIMKSRNGHTSRAAPQKYIFRCAVAKNSAAISTMARPIYMKEDEINKYYDRSSSQSKAVSKRIDRCGVGGVGTQGRQAPRGAIQHPSYVSTIAQGCTPSCSSRDNQERFQLVYWTKAGRPFLGQSGQSHPHCISLSKT